MAQTQTILVKRSTVAGHAPTSLALSEIAANIANDPPTLWIGTAAGPKQFFEAEAIEDAPDDSVYGRSDGEWVAVPTVSDTAPDDPFPNALWWDTNTGRLFLYFESTTNAAWVEVGPHAT